MRESLSHGHLREEPMYKLQQTTRGTKRQTYRRTDRKTDRLTDRHAYTDEDTDTRTLNDL